MKKNSFMLILALLLSTCTTMGTMAQDTVSLMGAPSTYYLSTVDFQSLSAGAKYNNITYTSIVQDGTNKYLQIDSSVSGAPSVTFGLGSISTTRLTAEFMYKPVYGTDYINISILGRDGNDTMDYPYVSTQVHWGQLRNMAGDVANSLSYDKFYKVQFDINPDTYVFDVYIDDVKVNATPWPFRNNSNVVSSYSPPLPFSGRITLKTLTIQSSSPGTVTNPFRAGFDDVCVYNGAPYILPTPTPDISPTPTPPSLPFAGNKPGYLFGPEYFDIPLHLVPGAYAGYGADGDVTVNVKDSFDTYLTINSQISAKSFLQFPLDASQVKNGVFTASFDYKPAKTTDSFRILLEGKDSDDATVKQYINVPLSAFDVGGQTIYNTNTFSTIALVVDTVHATYDIYINGEKKNTSSFAFAVPNASSVAFESMKISSGAGAGLYRGDFDDIAVYAGLPSGKTYQGVTLQGSSSVMLASNSSVTVKASSFNNTGVSFTGTLIAILKNGNKAVDIQMIKNLAVNQGMGSLGSVDFDIPSQRGNYEVKLMLWRSDANFIKPIATKSVAVDAKSAVYVSSRAYRSYAGSGGADISTPDSIKRFMATGNKWSYITSSAQIQSIVNLGATFQGALNTCSGTPNAETGRIPGGMVSFAGNALVAPWMYWGAQWGCINRPEYYNTVFSIAKTTIDAGATEFQHDDAAANYGALSWAAGCFCDNCISGFRQYLKDNLSAAQISAMGITDIDSFNYKTWIVNQYGITTDAEYLAIRSTLPQNEYYKKFQLVSSENYYTKLRSEMSAYAGRNISLSVNMNAMSMNNIGIDEQYLSGSFDYGITEHSEAAASLDYVFSAARLRTDTGTPLIVSPVLNQKDKALVRPAIAYTYAMGHYMLVPWDIWLPGLNMPRYYGTIYEYGDMYQFIRENAFLFDGYEIPAKVGVLTDWQDITRESAGTYRNFVKTLFGAGIPYKALMVSYNPEYPLYSLNAEKLKGLDYVVAYSPTSQLSAQDLAVLTKSGVTVITPAQVNAAFIDAQPKSRVSGADDLYSIIRSDGENTALHIINNNGYHKPTNITASIASSFLFPDDEAYLYRPGRAPTKLSTTVSGGEVHMQIDSLDEWGIISFAKKGMPQNALWNLDKSYMGFPVGNPAPMGSGNMEGDRLQLQSSGKGINMTVTGDEGAQDGFSFVYKNITSPLLRDYSVQAVIENISGPIGASAGVMLRESPASNAKFASLRRTVNGYLYLDYRKIVNGTAQTISLGKNSTPFLKMQKESGLLVPYASVDGQNYTKLHAGIDVELAMASAGVFAMSDSTGTLATALMARMDVDEGVKLLSSADISNISIGEDAILIKTSGAKDITVTASIRGQSATIDKDMYTLSASTAAITIEPGSRIAGNAAGSCVLTITIPTKEGSVQQTLPVTVEDQILVFEENFESYDADGAISESVWKITGVPADGFVKAITRPAGITGDTTGGQCVHLKVDENPASLDILATYPKLQEQMAVEFDYMYVLDPAKTASGADITYIMGSGMNMSFFGGKTVFAYMSNGVGYTAQSGTQYNRWYKMKYEIDIVAGTFTWYVDGTAIAVNKAFRIPTTSLYQISFGTTTNSVKADIYVDNIKIYDK